MNRLIADATAQIETVRPVTADVLIKEAQSLAIDIRGEIVVNENSIANTSSILENVNSAVLSLVNTSRL